MAQAYIDKRKRDEIPPSPPPNSPTPSDPYEAFITEVIRAEAHELSEYGNSFTLADAEKMFQDVIVNLTQVYNTIKEENIIHPEKKEEGEEEKGEGEEKGFSTNLYFNSFIADRYFFNVVLVFIKKIFDTFCESELKKLKQKVRKQLSPRHIINTSINSSHAINFADSSKASTRVYVLKSEKQFKSWKLAFYRINRFVETYFSYLGFIKFKMYTPSFYKINTFVMCKKDEDAKVVWKALCAKEGMGSGGGGGGGPSNVVTL